MTSIEESISGIIDISLAKKDAETRIRDLIDN